MNQEGENIAAFTVFVLVVLNAVGLGIPVWYNKEHKHKTNTTIEAPNCVVHVNIREGLWQRYCIESRVENCQLDIQGIVETFPFISFINLILFRNLATVCFISFII